MIECLNLWENLILFWVNNQFYRDTNIKNKAFS